MRLIDADELIKRHCKDCNADVQESCKTDAICSLLIWLAEEPTVYAKPVRHGMWIHDVNNLYSCSECMKRETMSPKKLKDYCPNCGARMVGE